MERVGEYTLTHDLGGGDITRAYAATGADGASVRLCRLTLPGIDADALARFEAAAAQAASLTHYGIAPPLRWSASPPIYAITRMVRGVSLAHVAREAGAGGLVPADIAIGLGLEMANVLSSAHAAGIVHAGLSPDAVLVDDHGQVIVTDYAIAGLTTSLAPTSPHVMSAVVKNITPEQVSGADATPATDVFGLAVLLYRIVTGQDPFAAPTPLGMSIRVTMGNADPIEKHGAPVPDALAALLTSMLSPKPETRPTMQEVAASLSALVDPSGQWRFRVERAVRGVLGDLNEEKRPTLQDEAPLVPEDELPDYLRKIPAAHEPPRVVPADGPRTLRGMPPAPDDDDERPTIRRESPLVPDSEIPDYLNKPPMVSAVPARDERSLAVFIDRKRAEASPSAEPRQIDAQPPTRARGGALLWIGITLGALLLLGGAVLITMFLMS